jgi:hypothetical protein
VTLPLFNTEKNSEVSIPDGTSTKQDPEYIGSHRAHRSQATDNISEDFKANTVKELPVP